MSFNPEYPVNPVKEVFLNDLNYYNKLFKGLLKLGILIYEIYYRSSCSF
jgi:hypothetical protein